VKSGFVNLETMGSEAVETGPWSAPGGLVFLASSQVALLGCPWAGDGGAGELPAMIAHYSALSRETAARAVQ